MSLTAVQMQNLRQDTFWSNRSEVNNAEMAYHGAKVSFLLLFAYIGFFIMNTFVSQMIIYFAGTHSTFFFSLHTRARLSSPFSSLFNA